MFALIAIVGAVVTSMTTWHADAVPAVIAPASAPVAPASATDVSAAGPAAVMRAAPPPPATVADRSAPAASPRHWVSRQQAFERSPDLFAFVEELLPAATAGDGEARWLVSRVQEYCDGYARAPADYDRDTGLIERLALRGARPLGEARTRVASRCRRFGPGDALSFVQLVQQRQGAADAGSLAAEAALLAMGEPVEADAGYRRELVERVQASRDPDAYAALAPAMGRRAAGDAALVDQVAGTQASEFAWRLAACRLGLDCSPGGALMTTYCAHGGICAPPGTEDFSAFVHEAALTPDEAHEVERMVDELVNGPQPELVMR